LTTSSSGPGRIASKVDDIQVTVDDMYVSSLAKKTEDYQDTTFAYLRSFFVSTAMIIN
jgi:hypothetical protein